MRITRSNTSGALLKQQYTLNRSSDLTFFTKPNTQCFVLPADQIWPQPDLCIRVSRVWSNTDIGPRLRTGGRTKNHQHINPFSRTTPAPNPTGTARTVNPPLARTLLYSEGQTHPPHPQPKTRVDQNLWHNPSSSQPTQQPSKQADLPPPPSFSRYFYLPVQILCLRHAWDESTSIPGIKRCSDIGVQLWTTQLRPAWQAQWNNAQRQTRLARLFHLPLLGILPCDPSPETEPHTLPQLSRLPLTFRRSSTPTEVPKHLKMF
jgi:hypothetical protein